jgi:hypothetical protein
VDAAEFIRLAQGLTGTLVKDVTETDRRLLGSLLPEEELDLPLGVPSARPRE